MKLILPLLMPLLLFGQPQSPNFIMAKETFSSIAARDSSQDYLLRSTVGQLSIADTQSSTNYIFTSGFLSPVYIAPSAIMVLDRDSLLFGDIWMNREAQDSFVVSNAGNADLVIDSLHASTQPYQSVVSPLTIAPGESRTILYGVQVPDTLSYPALLLIHGNAGSDTLVLQAHGI
ncbi:MAG: hypothetical protein IPK53_12280 [bacterium]|nr:hypothetical protein [bacterium]